MSIASMIDHTILKATATSADIEKLCAEARQYGFSSVCVNSVWVKKASELLAGSPVSVCTVVGFPLGAMSHTAKAFEAEDAAANGANEIDMVIDIGAVLEGRWADVEDDVSKVVAAAKKGPKPALVKVILENCYLNKEQIAEACRICVKCGAEFVKTSTGFGTGGATVEDVALMKATVGDKALVKAAGGIRDKATAEAMIAAGASRIGCSAGVAIVS
ncbi:MAG: deoxyribose-phosphate aldolase [Treponemataceae bacterium]|nr:deoxyribose-phosphate aldolase [Treponemataceae bacterium]